MRECYLRGTFHEGTFCEGMFHEGTFREVTIQEGTFGEGAFFCSLQLELAISGLESIAEIVYFGGFLGTHTFSWRILCLPATSLIILPNPSAY